MACIYTFNGKKYNENELKDHLKSMKLEEASKYIPEVQSLPTPPMRKTWDELAIKRILIQAVQEGKDAVSWTPGEAQAARYDLSKSIDRIKYFPPDDNYPRGNIQAYDKQGNKVIDKGAMPNELPDIVGKEVADKILKTEVETKFSPRGYHNLEGADLKVGGEGMKAFYDKMLVDKANALVKKMGGKVEYENLPVTKKQLEELKNNRDNITPDQIAQDKYAKAWDEYTKEINRLTDNGKRFDPRSNEVRALESERDGIHDLMVEETIERMKKELKGEKIPIIKITPQMREQIKAKGFPLYSSGIPTFTPVDQSPFDNKPRLVPIDYNPFTNPRAS